MRIRNIKAKRNFFKGSVQAVGFTVIELIVVISVIGILATIGVVSYGSWRQTATVAQVKSDLNSVASAMENSRNFGNVYPPDVNTLTTVATSNNNTTFYGGSSDGGKTYCVSANNSQFPNLYYHISSANNSQGPQPGTCFPSNLTATVASTSSINLAWDVINGADSYTLQRDISASFPSPATIATQPGINFTSGGLASSTTYYYRVRATVSGTDSEWSATATATTNAVVVNAPSAPTMTVALNAGNVVATISPVTCTGSTAQYIINNRTNNGSWSTNITWSTTLTDSQVANDGVRYGYKAQARCWIDNLTYSTTATGSEFTYTDPITTPAAPTVAASTVSNTTTYSWNTISCPSGSSVRYQYRYTISPSGFDSGLTAIASSPVQFTTTTGGQTYTVAVQSQCYNSNISSAWSVAGQASYYRPIVQVLIVGGGGGGATNLSGGGGGGGVVSTTLTMTTGATTVTVGAGGTHSGNAALDGGNSAFGATIAYGGGHGSQRDTHDIPGYGATVGSGGGAAGFMGGGGGGGITWSGQGNDGGNGWGASALSGDRGVNSGGGGGGGAGSVGGGGSENTGGNGGNGMQSSISGVSAYYAGGGGGGSYYTQGTGGLGGGGSTAAGTANTGGGGGAYGAGNGGSGVVIISYPTGTMSATGGTITTSGGNTIHTFTTSGTFTVL